jgi:hypothetical protein
VASKLRDRRLFRKVGGVKPPSDSFSAGHSTAPSKKRGHAPVYDFQAARARQAARVALKHAEAALAEAQSQLESHSGIGINLALINRMRAAERRVDKAREALRTVEPSGSERAPRSGALVGVSARANFAGMITRLGKAGASSDIYLEAKLALLRMQAHQTIDAPSRG